MRDGLTDYSITDEGAGRSLFLSVDVSTGWFSTGSGRRSIPRISTAAYTFRVPRQRQVKILAVLENYGPVTVHAGIYEYGLCAGNVLNNGTTDTSGLPKLAKTTVMSTSSPYVRRKAELPGPKMNEESC